MLDREVPSELHELEGWVRPYALLRNAVVVAARTLAASAKAVLLSSGEALPLPLRFEEPSDEEATTRRILVEPDPAADTDGDARLRVVLLAPEGGEPEASAPSGGTAGPSGPSS
ncbi:MAG: hypothetical protein U0168_19125 [Nannocystaceae bacterium]